MNNLSKQKAFELLNSLNKLLENSTMLNERTFRKYLGIIIRVSDKYPELDKLIVECSKKLSKTELIGQFDLENVDLMINQLDNIIASYSVSESL